MDGDMKALVKSKPEPGIWIDDVPEPVCGHNDVLIKIVKTAICGTDIHIFNWDEWSRETVPVPMVIGHEFVGVIAEVGSEVDGFAPGDRVSGEGHITCGYCRNCRAGRRHLCRNTIGVGVNRPGCFAEFLVIPDVNAFKLPDDVTDEMATILDPFGNATHTALSFDLVGEDVLITGAGPIGIMAAAISRHVGARHIVVTDINEYRLELARKMGASLAINAMEQSLAGAMHTLGMTEGFDVGMEMSGNPKALADLLSAMNYGGKVAALGIPAGDVTFDWKEIVLKGLHVKGVYGREIFETWHKMISMLQSGIDLAPVRTHLFPINDFGEAFDIMNTGNSGKVVLDWS
jgi:threonine 3-dehydrogenase